MGLKKRICTLTRERHMPCPSYESQSVYVHLAGTLLAVTTFLVLAAVICVFSAKAETAREYLASTCSDVSAKFSAEQMSDIRRNELLQNYRGKWVKWTGTVSGISETLWGIELSIKCARDRRTPDATVSFDNSWKSRLQRLTAGQQVQFAGQLEGYAELGGISIKEGELDPREERGTPPSTPGTQPYGQSQTVVPPSNHPSDSRASDANQAVQSPSLSIGDEFIIEHKNHTNPKLSYVGERKVVSLDGNRVRITARNLNSNYVRTLDYDRQWNVIAMRGKAGEGFDYTPPVKYYDFPLYPGKRWNACSTERNIKTGNLREHTIFAEVGGWEMVTVPAGTFKAIKVMIRNEVKDLQTGQVTSGTDTSWYAPIVKRSVKSELTAFNARDGRDDVQVAQVIRYSVR